MNKRTKFSAANGRFSVVGAAALMAGSGLLIAAGASYLDSTQETQVTFNSAAWSYISHLRLDIAHVDFVQAASELKLGLDRETFPEEAAHLAFSKPLVDKRHSSRHHLGASVRRASVPQPAVLVTTQTPVAYNDQVITTQSAVVSALLVQASTSQIAAFRQMHRQLRGQLFASLHPESMQMVPTQLVSQPTVGTERVEALAEQSLTIAAHGQPKALAAQILQVAAKSEEHARFATSTAATVAPILSSDEAAASVTASVADTRLTSVHLAATRHLSDVNYEVKTPLSARIVHSTAASAIETPVEASKNPFASYNAFREQTEGTYKQISQLSREVFASESVATQSLTQASGKSVTTQSGTSILVSGGTGYSRKIDYSTTDLYKMWQAWNARNQVAPAAPAAKPQVNTLALNAQRPVQLAQAPQDTATASDASPAVVPNTPAVVEAFEWSAAVQDTSTEVVTLEGWKKIQAADHWPVIYWNPDDQAQAAMISHNTAVMLSKFADAQLQPDAAIVFGKIPAGWDVEFSDRSEKVIYLNAQNQTEATPENARYFAFINAAPGAQLVTLKAALGAETAAVAVPVLNGSSTYLDLTAVSKRSFSGYVLDAGAQARQGVKGATVSVVGQPNAVFFTTESGYFHLSEVYAVGTYPVFVETMTPVGFKHRYRVTPASMDGVDLFRMSDEQIRGWVGQLEGGVSPDSGVIVAAMPSLIRTYGDGRLFPATRTLLGSATLTPETYTLSPSGALEESKPLEAAAPRYVSVQVPSGPVISSVEDNNRNVVWSQLVLAQPGVVSVVGPY